MANISDSGGTSAAKPLSAQGLDNKTSEVLLRLYLLKRLQGQLDFYRARVREFDANSGFMVGVGAFIMALSSLIATIGAVEGDAKVAAAMALITALLPAFAALVASFRQLYQWDKQSGLYRDAVLGLEEAKLVMPDDDIFDPRIANAVLNKVVAATEDVFIAEINQWGQIALGKEEEDDDFNKLLRGLDDEDREKEEKQGKKPSSDTDSSNVSGVG